MTTSTARSLIWLSVVVLASPLAGCGGSKVKKDPFGPAIVRVGDTVAAQVDGTPIYVSDVRREGVAQGLIDRSEELPPGGKLYTQLLNELVDQRLLALEATRRGLDNNDDARRRVAAARERILGNMLVESVVDSAVTEDAIRRMYGEQVDLVELGDEVRARDILVDSEDDAKEIITLLKQGKDFAQLAQNRSKDQTTRLEGGDLGYFTPDKVAPEIAHAAFDTKVGQVSEPFKADNGWHVLRVEDRRAEHPPTFEEMRPKIVRFLTLDQIQQLMNVLQKNAEVKVMTPPEQKSGDEVEPPSAPPPAAAVSDKPKTKK
jgi:peptidyl-prolyl cis-trans isomerase C